MELEKYLVMTKNKPWKKRLCLLLISEFKSMGFGLDLAVIKKYIDIKMKITKATRFNMLVTSVFSLKYFANVAAIYVCKATIIQTPIENIKLRL